MASAAISVVVVTFIKVIMLIRGASADIGSGTGNLSAVSGGVGNTVLTAAVIGFGLGCWLGLRTWRRPRKKVGS